MEKLLKLYNTLWNESYAIFFTVSWRNVFVSLSKWSFSQSLLWLLCYLLSKAHVQVHHVTVLLFSVRVSHTSCKKCINATCGIAQVSTWIDCQPLLQLKQGWTLGMRLHWKDRRDDVYQDRWEARLDGRKSEQKGDESESEAKVLCLQNVEISPFLNCTAWTTKTVHLMGQKQNWKPFAGRAEGNTLAEIPEVLTK